MFDQRETVRALLWRFFDRKFRVLTLQTLFTDYGSQPLLLLLAFFDKFVMETLVITILSVDSMKIKRIHVIKRGDRWAVKKQGNLRATGVFDTKREATVVARTYKKNGYDIIIHNQDGTINKWEKFLATKP